SGLNLPDAADGEMIELLARHQVPTILFTATFNRRERERFASAGLVDYFLKDTVDVVDRLVETVERLTQPATASILVVDDTRSVRMELVRLLRRQNYEVIEADCGEVALETLAQNPHIQLVITDFNMPGLNGAELTREIRNCRSSEALRVIGLSSSSDPFLSAALLKVGASDFIYRPFVAEEVVYRVEHNIQTLAQMKHLRHLAERDPLTGLYNRRAFFEQAHARFDAMRVSRKSGGLAILDIDHFKRVNDTYGHDLGDVAIRAVAGVLLDEAAAQGFLAARFGGEEFVMMFTDKTTDEVLACCEAVRLAVEACDVRSEQSRIPLTASIGISVISLDEGIDNNLNAADQMLYMAKNQGRNRVISDAQFCLN
ncbi:MAG TPA: diguanylate cyclase, partial [Novosphingobium sp.]|nr:diguanylate cyclase [Novosphingobium sp.]